MAGLETGKDLIVLGSGELVRALPGTGWWTSTS